MTRLATPYRATIRIDDASSTITYVGEAAFGQSESNAAWRIKKLETVGSVLKITWADGNDSFDNIWDNRATISYS
jgi:hypothetical protein